MRAEDKRTKINNLAKEKCFLDPCFLHYLSPMYLLRVSQKVLFIFNLCWVLGWVFRILPVAHWPDFVIKTILVCGWILALPVGIVWYGTVLILLYNRKIDFGRIPRWLFIVNALFLPIIALGRLL